MGVPHKNVEWTEVLKVLTPLLPMRGWGSSERERSSQGYCTQQICGMTSLVHSKRWVNGVRLPSLTSPLRLKLTKWETEFRFWKQSSVSCREVRLRLTKWETEFRFLTQTHKMGNRVPLPETEFRFLP
jgi:hypothetical protein